MTRAQIRNRIRRLVRDYPPMDTLGTAIDADDTSLVMTRGLFGGAPQILELGTEWIYVGTWTAATMTASNLVRGYLGTSAASHSTGAEIVVSPRYGAEDINESIDHALERMSSNGLYQMKSETLTFDPSILGYGLPADTKEVYEIRAEMPGPENNWPEIRTWRLSQDMPSDAFADGVALILGDEGFPGLRVQVRYRARYDDFTDDSTEATALGVQSYAQDLILVGAICDLVSTDEVKRTQITSGAESQRSQDVPARHSMSLYEQMEKRFSRRIMEVQHQLAADFPPRRTFGR